MAEPRWWIRSTGEGDGQWHLEMHEGQGAACDEKRVVEPLERVAERPSTDTQICGECLRIEPFARGMSHAVGSRGERGELPEPP